LQLIILLLFVLPGTVYQFFRARLRGPRPDDSSATNRVLRALAVSAALATIYAYAFGRPILEQLRDVQGADADKALRSVRPLAAWALLLLFVVPGSLAALTLVQSKVPRPKWLRAFRLSYDPTPRAWDFAFNGISPTYVRILTADNRYIGGWYGTDSFVSSYPEPREMFLEISHQMSTDGEFGPEVAGSAGVYVRCDDVRLIEFVDATATPSAP
jgi:hypothetical protein